MTQAPPPTVYHYSPATASMVVAVIIGLLVAVLAITFADDLHSDDDTTATPNAVRTTSPSPGGNAPTNEVEPEMRAIMQAANEATSKP